MNKHRKINKRLTDFALGELSEELKTEAATHVSECPQCACELKRLEALLRCTGRIGELSADARTCQAAERAVLEAVENQQSQGQPCVPDIRMVFVHRPAMDRRKIKLVAAAAIVVAMLGGVTFWPSTTSEDGKWWLGPPAAWGQQIMAKLDKIEALVHREQFVFVGRYGRTHVSGTWSRIYEARDRSRKDRYYEDTDEDTFGDNDPNSVLQHVTWKVPDGQDLISYDVSFEHQCYTIRVLEGGACKRDSMEELLFYVSLLDKADRILDMEMFDGRECVGFEISADKYGDNPQDWIDRIWFDVRTRLPVRIENHGRPITNSPGQTYTTIHDQFEYYARIPAEMFEPEIPEDFIDAEPSEVQAAKQEQDKGPMIYADVPPGLRDEIVAALKSVKTAIYRKRVGFVREEGWVFPVRGAVYVSRYDWRKDSYSGEQLQEIEWFVTDKEDWGQTSFDFNDKNFKLTQTIVNFTDGRYKVVLYGIASHPDNPMDHIIFLGSWVDRADRLLESEQIEGIDCFGLELSAKKYGTNPDASKHRMWFDAETKLPVRMEFEWLQDDGPRKMVDDEFQWNPELSAETFTPNIPAGFELVESGGM